MNEPLGRTADYMPHDTPGSALALGLVVREVRGHVGSQRSCCCGSGKHCAFWTIPTPRDGRSIPLPRGLGRGGCREATGP